MIIAADLYCGAGGASAGLFAAADRLELPVHLTAVNHWDVAIETHSANFPGSTHLLTEVEAVKPKEAVPGGRLDMLLAGPSCVHFSQARGGRPSSDQQRSGAWEVIRWCRELDVANVLVENVPEFQTWGPIDTATGKPCKERKGMYFRQFIRMLQDLGYRVEYRVLCSADFGDATTRKRLFVQARKGDRPIVWAKPTHRPTEELPVLPGMKAWKPARDIINWELPSASIFSRKKQLAPKTMQRIVAGLKKFCGMSFTIGQQSGAIPRSTDDPIATVATAGAISLVEPFLVVLRGTSERQLENTAQSLDEPVPTILTGGHMALCEPFLVRYNGGDRNQSLDNPLTTIDTSNRFGLCEPFLVPVGGPTGCQKERSIDVPLGTVLAQNHLAVCEPYLVSYYGNSEGAHSTDDPLDTVTTRDRFGLVMPKFATGEDETVAVLDIKFRMLTPEELAAAHSFPSDYKFAGGREARVKQVGNSWTVSLSTALCHAILRSEVGTK